MSAWDWFATMAVVLCVKFWVVAMIQGVERMRFRAFVRPEDASFFGKGAAPVGRERPMVERAQGALRNDLENVPWFFLLSALCLQRGVWLEEFVWLGWSFVGLRVLHGVFYVRPTQPLRNFCYVGGLGVMAAMATRLTMALCAG